MAAEPAAPASADERSVDVLVIGAGTGMAAALAAHELGLEALVIEKTEYVGGSMARSGGAFWIPGNAILARHGAPDSLERAERYLRAIVDPADAPEERWKAFLRHGPDVVELLERRTPMRFQWDRGYADYHAEQPGGSASGRSCEARPFDASVLGDERGRLRPPIIGAPIPMPITSVDYRWMNLMGRMPLRSGVRIAARLAQGVGGLALGREYLSGGQAFAAGLFAGLLAAGVPVQTETAPTELVVSGDRVIGAVVEQASRRTTIHARRGVVISAGGFDHDLAMRHKHQSASLQAGWSLGNPGNTGDGLRLAEAVGAGTALMDQAWWFPAVAPLLDGDPQVLLAERSLPGSLMVDQTGSRFINESIDYMTLGQTVLRRERDGDPVDAIWLIFDQRYRNGYVFAGQAFPGMPLPKAWYDAGIAHRAADPAELAAAIGVPAATLQATIDRFNTLAAAGVDDDFGRGASAYDRYYGDPTVSPNPNLRPLRGRLYAVRVVLSDLGTCGGITADGRARALRGDGSPIAGLYAIGNAAANAFGATYPGAGATIGQGVVFGYIAARDAAGQTT